MFPINFSLDQFLNQGGAILPKADIWQGLETFLVVTNGVGYHWHLLGKRRRMHRPAPNNRELPGGNGAELGNLL